MCNLDMTCLCQLVPPPAGYYNNIESRAPLCWAGIRSEPEHKTEYTSYMYIVWLKPCLHSDDYIIRQSGLAVN